MSKDLVFHVQHLHKENKERKTEKKLFFGKYKSQIYSYFEIFCQIDAPPSPQYQGVGGPGCDRYEDYRGGGDRYDDRLYGGRHIGGVN